MDSYKENWMKDYEHWGFCNKAMPTVGPLGIYPWFNGAVMERPSLTQCGHMGALC